MKIIAIIPAYNESSNIVKVIDDIKSRTDIDMVVVNDGSTDNTGKIAEETGKAYVINLPCNIGIGGCVQTGFKFAKNNDYDAAFQFDGDGQHKASEIEKILKPIQEDRADVVIGSRFLIKNIGFRSTRFRRIGIKIFQLVNSALINQSIKDNTSGFRAYNKKAIHFLSENYPSDYPEPEAIIILGKNGFRIQEVSVEMLSRESGESSISGFLSLYYMMKVLLSIFMSSFRPKIYKE